MKSDDEETVDVPVSAIRDVQNTICDMANHLLAVERMLPTIRRALRAMPPSESEATLRKLTSIFGADTQPKKNQGN